MLKWAVIGMVEFEYVLFIDADVDLMPDEVAVPSAAAAQAGGVDRGLSSSQGWLLSFNLVVASLSSLGFATADEFSVRKNTVVY